MNCQKTKNGAFKVALADDEIEPSAAFLKGGETVGLFFEAIYPEDRAVERNWKRIKSGCKLARLCAKGNFPKTEEGWVERTDPLSLRGGKGIRKSVYLRANDSRDALDKNFCEVLDEQA